MPALDYVSGGGAMGALTRSFDWSRTPLGPLETWPQALLALVSVMLNAKQPMFIVWGPELTLLYNDAYVEIAGEVRNDAFGQPFSRARADVWAQVRPLVERALSGEAIYLEDFQIQTERSGQAEDAWFTISYTPARNGDSRIAGLFCTMVETTWKVRSARALRESEERFRQFAEHTTDVVWIINEQTRKHEYLNPAYEKIWGVPAESVDDVSHWAKTVHPEDRKGAMDALERAFQGEAVDYEYRIVRPNGAVRWIRDTFFPIRDPSGRVRWAGGIAEDITRHEGSMVYVIDGNRGTRHNLVRLLQRSGYQAKEFKCARDFLDVAAVLVPGCVVLDIRSPEVGDFVILRELKARRIHLPVVVIGEARGDVSYGVQVMRAGATDFLDVSSHPDQLLQSIALALADIREETERDRELDRTKSVIAGLPVRERQVLDRLVAGGTNKVIAKELGLSPRTVEAHRARLMERLAAKSLPELVQKAVLAGVKSPPQSDEEAPS